MNNRHSATNAASLTRRQISRRQFARQTLAATCGLAWLPIGTTALSAAGIADHYAGLDSSQYLGTPTIETEIDDEEVFTEGPAVNRAGEVFFTNVPVQKILKWDPQAKKLSVYRTGSNRANGLMFEPDGNLLACEGGAGRVTRTDWKTGTITVLADSYQNMPLGAPNDLTADAQGRIYFTSRFDGNAPKSDNVDSVYRIDPDGSLTRIIAEPQTHKPNGVVISPDNKTLYLIEAHPAADRYRNIQAYDLQSDGTVANQRTLINFYPGRSGDGMCIDAQGNLYVAAGLHKTRKTSETLDTKPGIHVISPAGKLLAYAQTPVDTVTNCTFGGKDLKTLYVTCGTKLVSLRTVIPGKPTYRPNA